MTAAALAGAWAVLAAAVAIRGRPYPDRTVALRPPPGRSRRPPVERVGRFLATRAGRASVSPLTARRIGLAALVLGAVAPLAPILALPAVTVAWAAPAVSVRRSHRRRLTEIADSVPEVVDLLVLGVGAGLSVHQALVAAGGRGRGPLSVELRAVVAAVGRGRRLADTLDDLPQRAGEAVRPLVTALTAAERYGAPLVPSLDRLAAETRVASRRRAEEAARQVPVKLLFPLVVCILPAFGLLTVVPLLAAALQDLRI